MKVENYSYDTFPSYDQDIDGIVDLKGNKENLRCRLLDVTYQDDCIIRFLFPNTILDETRRYPLVIHVQGSGWYPQDMNDHIFDFMPIVKKGFAYAIIQYRPAPEYHFPTQVYDVKNAIRFIQEHAKDYPIDLDSLYLSGDSSGGHTALLTLFTYNQNRLDNNTSLLPPLKGCIDLYGPYDFTHLDDWYSKYDWQEESNYKDLLGSIDQDTLLKASPAYYLKNAPELVPILILHGSKDHVVPFTQSVSLYQDLKTKGCDVTFGRVKDADHGRSIFYVSDVYNCIEEFLKSHL